MRCLVWMALVLAGCASGAAAKREPIAMGDVGAVRGVMVLGSGLEGERDALAAQVVEAQRIMEAFAEANGWGAAAKAVVVEAVEVVQDHDALWERYVEVCKVPGNVPAPVVKPDAAPDCGTLLAVAPEAYAKAKPLYAGAQQDAWTRLLAHELIHLLHIRVLAGNEEAMGPRWFFEGLAVVGSGQALGLDLHYTSAAEALAATRSVAPNAYARYAAALRFFISETPLSELVARASSPDFEARLSAAPRR